jgi:Mrp family chromosome partitioning ATPase
MVQDPDGTEAEQYRRLRENLRSSLASQGNLCVELTSALTAKTAVSAVCLGAAFAETGASVLVIDADFRSQRGQVSRPPGGGLAKFLSDESEKFEAVIERNAVPGLDVLPAGVADEPAGRLLASSRMADLVKNARGIYEVVIVSAPPVPRAADAIVLGELTQGVVLAVEVSKANARGVSESVASLLTAGIGVVGLAVVRRRRSLPLPRKTAVERAAKSHVRLR